MCDAVQTAPADRGWPHAAVPKKNSACRIRPEQIRASSCEENERQINAAPSNGVPIPDPFAAAFSASATWHVVKIPFSALARTADGAKVWTGRDLRALVFELSGAPESLVWLELDNVRFY
jgi:hypothetical protein